MNVHTISSKISVNVVLISLYVNSGLNGYQELMVFTMIVFMNTRETFCKEKKCPKARPILA